MFGFLRALNETFLLDREQRVINLFVNPRQTTSIGRCSWGIKFHFSPTSRRFQSIQANDNEINAKFI